MTDEPASSPHRLSRLTTPTWEIELLISAAVVFSLLQLLDPLEQLFARYVHSLAEWAAMLLIYSHLYTKVVLYILIAAFVVHLAARAHWVSLVGVHSVFPGGIRWDNVPGSPFMRRLLQAQGGAVETAIEAADNRSSLVFAFGIVCAQFALLIYVATVVTVGLATALHWLTDVGFDRSLLGVIVAFSVVYLTIWALDRWLGSRLDHQRGVGRLLYLAYRGSGMLLFNRFCHPLLPLLVSNVGGRRGTWLFNLLLILAVTAATAHSAWQARGTGLLQSEQLPPLRRDGGLNPAHYADQRSGLLRYSGLPSIQSEWIEQPYLRLFIPYQPARFDALGCGQQDAATDAAAVTAAQQRWADCIAVALELRLDDHPIPRVDALRHRDADSGLDGLLVRVDVRHLAIGRHQLQLRRPPRSGQPPSPEDADHDRIVFWR